MQVRVDAVLKEAMSKPGEPPEVKKVSKFVKRTINNPKSPSDTTIYAPALNLTPEKVSKDKECTQTQAAKNVAQEQQLVQFLEQVHLQVTNDDEANKDKSFPVDRSAEKNQPQPDDEVQAGPSNQDDNVKMLNWMEAAVQSANEMIVNSERMKAKLDAPKGMGISLGNHSEQIDDKFFHITCHVDPALKIKIEQGQFVELEKLLLKDRPFTKSGASDHRMGLFNKDGVTYFAPTFERESKISNVRRWDQAFRVYAAIYSKANQLQASEIWQYVHIIHSAASTYQWSNVAEYDYTFRQLMSAYPQRSWAKTYLQGWNLIMKDLLSREGGHSKGGGFSKENICWPFNKGKCTDLNCPKEHRCSYCGKWGHSVQVCRKKKKGFNSNNHNNQAANRSTIDNDAKTV